MYIVKNIQIAKNISSADELFNDVNWQNGLIIDVRSLDNSNKLRIKDAISLDLMSEYFVEYFSGIKKDKSILIYCEDGTRSKIAIKFLDEMGYSNLFILNKGIKQWKT